MIDKQLDMANFLIEMFNELSGIDYCARQEDIDKLKSVLDHIGEVELDEWYHATFTVYENLKYDGFMQPLTKG